LPKVLCDRSHEISSHIAAQVIEYDRGKAMMGSLDPELLTRPTVLSAIVLDRIRSLLSDGLPPIEAYSGDRKSLSSAIRASSNIAVISEYKPHSPSSPPLSVPPDPELAAQAYASSGVAGVSVLVEPNYFLGSPELFSFFRDRVDVPMLFKDFVFTKEQVAFASLLGADALLLIAKALRPDALDELVNACNSFDLEPLVEVHDAADLAKLSSIQSFDSVEMIGVNCRDLRTMKADLDTFASLAPSLPSDKVIVAESGVKTALDLNKVCSADAVLIGSMFMNADDLESQLKTTLQISRGLVK